jgi:L-2,4-diaminobutyrate transaminase
VLRKHEVLLIADEVITGFGRTGSWFAGPGYGMDADLITVAKGLTSGYFPMSACLVSEKVADVLYRESEAEGMFGHGFTTSGHPVGAAVALANLDLLAGDGLLANAERVGAYLLARLGDALGGHPLVGDIRGKGLMIGIEFDQDRTTRKPFADVAGVGGRLSQACLDEGLIVRGGHGRVVAALAPPLILSLEDADEIVERLQRAVKKFAAAVRQREC